MFELSAFTLIFSELARDYHRSPELISYQEVAGWLYYLIKERGLSASSVNIAVNAVRFLYGATLERNTDQTLTEPGCSCELRVRKGKGGKERVLPLSNRLLKELGDYWRAQRQPSVSDHSPNLRTNRRIALRSNTAAQF